MSNILRFHNACERVPTSQTSMWHVNNVFDESVAIIQCAFSML